MAACWKEALFLQLQQQCDKNKLPPFSQPCVGFPICTPHWCYPGFQISQDFIHVHFLAKEQRPTLVFSKRVNWTGCQFKQKNANWKDGFQFVSADLLSPNGTHNGVWMCVKWRGGRVWIVLALPWGVRRWVWVYGLARLYLIDQPHVCLTVPLGAIWHSPLIFPLSLPIHLIFFAVNILLSVPPSAVPSAT